MLARDALALDAGDGPIALDGDPMSPAWWWHEHEYVECQCVTCDAWLRVCATCGQRHPCEC